MRRTIAWTTTLLVGAASAAVAPAQAPRPQAAPRSAAAPTPGAAVAKTPPTRTAAPAPLDPAAQKAKLAADAKARGEMNLLLDEWEKQSKQVTSLMVVFDRTDIMPKWGNQYYQGQAFLKTPDLACLEFKRAILNANGEPQYTVAANGLKSLVVEKEPYERIVCTGSEVLQYEWDVKEIYVYPLDKESRQKALQQGPLPFLFNMKAAEARQRYDMTLLKSDIADCYLILIKPLEEIDAKNFQQAYIYLDKQKFQPKRLLLFPVGDKERQEFQFNVIVANNPKAIDDRVYQPITSVPGWTVNRNPDEARAAGARPVAAGPGAGAGIAPTPRPGSPTPKRTGGAPPAPRTAVRP